MTDERMIEELTKIGFPNCCYRSKREVYNIVDPYGHVYPSFYAPDYLTDHNAIQRVIDGMDREGMDEGITGEYTEYVRILICDVCERYLSYVATPRQKCEAVLKAYGKWEEGK